MEVGGVVSDGLSNGGGRGAKGRHSLPRPFPPLPRPDMFKVVVEGGGRGGCVERRVLCRVVGDEV